jgi:hypothetical protein
MTSAEDLDPSLKSVVALLNDVLVRPMIVVERDDDGQWVVKSRKRIVYGPASLAACRDWLREKAMEVV